MAYESKQQNRKRQPCYMPLDLWEAARARARAEHRTFSGLVQVALVRYLGLPD